MLATSMRLYRINKVYEKYVAYLDEQRVALSQPLLHSTHHSSSPVGDAGKLRDSTEERTTPS